MAASASGLNARWCRRYKPFFIVVGIILVVQGFLAYSFYTIFGMDEEGSQWQGNTKRIRGNIQLVQQQSKHIDEYNIDDEDSLSNIWDKSARNSNNRHSEVKILEQDGLHNEIVVPNVQNLISRTDRLLSDYDLVAKEPSSVLNTSKQVEKKDNESLNFSKLNFKPWCEILSRDAISAINRARSQGCKEKIANVTCLIKAGKMYPTQLPRYCPVEGDKKGTYLGCFKDASQKRILPRTFTKLSHNTPLSCIQKCFQSGFQYAGTQYSLECFCGREPPPESMKIDESECNMACPKNLSLVCGGYFSMNVYATGLPKFVKNKALPAVDTEKNDPVTIVFLLTVNGRAVRQVRRLIRALYHTRHYFFIHVDSRQDYLFRELLPLEEKFPNIRLSRWRLSTIWGGASLLQMLLQCICDLLAFRNWKWDYVLNLSESDFPIKSLSQLEGFLTANKGMNFVKSHGQDTQRFIAKQGLDKTFYECDTHMWRIGERTLPWGIQIDGGSDWVALSRDFCTYVVKENNELLTGLKTVFSYTLLPAESFFHTVLQNSEYCKKIIDNNLHVTNWKRKQGCKCQYRHVVDWCGCSPNDFKIDDWPRIKATENRPFFFGRKFEPVVNQQIIEQVERWINGPRELVSPVTSSYWQNEYHWKDKSPAPDDAKISIYNSLGRLACRQLRDATKPCNVVPLNVREATLFFETDIYKGTLILFEASAQGISSPVLLEVQARPRQHYIIHKPVGPTGRLKFIQVGTDFDLKEQLFRNFGRIIGPFSEPAALHKWGPGKEFSATFVWVDPTKTVAGSYEVRVESGNQDLHLKPVFRQPLRPGIWTLLLMYNWVLVAETHFLVVPLSVYNTQPVDEQKTPMIHSGPGKQPYVDHDFSNVETLLKYTNKTLMLQQAVLNSQKAGKDLENWIDGLTTQFWTVQDLCFVSVPQHPTGGALCLALDMDPCQLTLWSSKSPDPKSEVNSDREAQVQ
ncbi:xylosyltransferase oxt-like isoform X1 [Limulus polyphemus]|uniref:protein xylosyltransferase n=1 Tax=Limulus polyphemus TaxID=6850 RepID=A0ABM1B765_LIMPO|nr:xylosyltransferase oxt-like isoform X1 [Limulus polyphemus]